MWPVSSLKATCTLWKPYSPLLVPSISIPSFLVATLWKLHPFLLEMIPGSYIASFPGPRPASHHLQYGSFWSLHWGSFTLASFPGLPWLQFLITCSMQKQSQLSFTLHPTWAHKNRQVATLATGSYALLTSTRGCTTTNTMEVMPSSYSFHNVEPEGR